MSIREDNLSNFFTALQTVPDTVPGAKVRRNYDIEVEDFPTVIQFDGDQDTSQDTSGIDRNTLNIDVECYVAVTDFTLIAAGIDALFVAVLQAILADPQRNDLAIDTTHNSFSDLFISRAEGQGATAGFVLGFEIEFWTVTNDPTQQALG